MLQLLPLFAIMLSGEFNLSKLSHSGKPVFQAERVTIDQLKPFFAADLIVGYPDSNEVRIIKGSYSLDGRIIIVNHGTLILDTCTFTHRGDAYVLNNGRMIVRGGSYTVLQQYAYTYGGMVVENGELNFQNTTLSFNGQSWGIGLLDSARYNVLNVNLTNGFITNSMMHKSRVNVRNTNIAGEFLVSDSVNAYFNRVDFVLIWLYFPDSSRVDLRLPKSDSGFLVHYEIRPGSPGVQGIKYTMVVDSSNNVNWGTFPLKGCDASIRNSRLRTTGLIVGGSGTQELNGIVNNSTYYNYTLPLTDRRYYLDSTKLFTWNVYAFDSVNLTIRSSVFGEACAWGEPVLWIENSICDGSGGYLGVFDSCQAFVYRSTVNSQTISGVHALLVGVESNFRVGAINSARMSLMVFINSFYDSRPVANDTSFIYIGLVNPPPSPSINSLIRVTGTATMVPGPYNPVRFERYRLLYGPGQSPTQWFQIGTIHTSPVENDTLERWNTNGLSVGWYTLRLIMRNTNGDTVDVLRQVYLNAPGVEEEAAAQLVRFEILSANPARRDLALRYVLPRSLDVSIEIYNVIGERVTTLFSGRRSAGEYAVVWKGTDDRGKHLPSGVYFCRFQAGAQEVRRKTVLLD